MNVVVAASTAGSFRDRRRLQHGARGAAHLICGQSDCARIRRCSVFALFAGSQITGAGCQRSFCNEARYSCSCSKISLRRSRIRRAGIPAYFVHGFNGRPTRDMAPRIEPSANLAPGRTRLPAPTAEWRPNVIDAVRAADHSPPTVGWLKVRPLRSSLVVKMPT
jgi:hypothetical protein